MAAAVAVAEPLSHRTHSLPLRVCFSYAAYAKSLIAYLRSSNIPVERGLSDTEFAAVESSFRITFPPDLRSILQEGLPVGPGFPNWRSSSKQQLEVLTTLPIVGICKRVSRNDIWIEDWGDRPDDCDEAERLARAFLREAPALVPIYRHFYIPATPGIAGNPVFYVYQGHVKQWSFDIAGFFQKVEFRISGSEEILRRPRVQVSTAAPAWAARDARRIELWTKMAAKGYWWWSGELDGCLERVWWRLREGGWNEDDVREMMMMTTEVDQPTFHLDWQTTVMSLSATLVRGGWPAHEVEDLLGEPVRHGYGAAVADGDSCIEFHH